MIGLLSVLTKSLRKIVLPTLIMAISSMPVLAQDEEPVEKRGFDRNRLFAGGGFGLGLGTGYFFVSLSPQVGYEFNRYFSAGAGVNGQYSTVNNFFFRQTSGVAGLNVFGRVYPLRFLVLQVQPEANYIWGKVRYDSPPEEFKFKGRVTPSLLLSAGGAIGMGAGGRLLILGNYDVLNSADTPYGNDVFLSLVYNFPI